VVGGLHWTGAVATGAELSCATAAGSRRLYCWGDASGGALGYPRPLGERPVI
jgi:hypothetical protein